MLVALASVRLCDGEFDEEQRQHGKYRRLDKTDEQFKSHERDRESEWNKKAADGKHYFARENIPEKTE